MEWRKVRQDFEVNERLNDNSNTEMHVSNTGELTDDEINFELKDKEKLIDRLMKRIIDNEDYYVAHIT